MGESGNEAWHYLSRSLACQASDLDIGILHMKIHEYQAKELLKKFGVAVPRGRVATTADEAYDIARKIISQQAQPEGCYSSSVVVKAQIHSGGRGKGGGVKVCKDAEEAKAAAAKILGMRLVTHQTGPEGRIVKKVLVEEGSNIARELYLGMTLDRSTAMVTLMASPEGGMDIEKVAVEHPEKIFKLAIDSENPPPPPFSKGGQQATPPFGKGGQQATPPFSKGGQKGTPPFSKGGQEETPPFEKGGQQATPPFEKGGPGGIYEITKKLGLTGQLAQKFTQFVTALYNAYVECDCSLAEINPLVVTKEGELLALDAKINLDDNALYRHPEFESLRDLDEEDPKEMEAKKFDLNYISLNGNIGCMVNGAGLAMATMDIIKLCGGEPANFLDVGGGATKENVAQAFKIILQDPNVKALLINIFGGIVKCDMIAEGIVSAAREIGVKVPLVVRLQGTNVELGRKILADSGLNIISAEGLKEAAEKVVRSIG